MLARAVPVALFLVVRTTLGLKARNGVRAISSLA
jgi:hypothetical protein